MVTLMIMILAVIGLAVLLPIVGVLIQVLSPLIMVILALVFIPMLILILGYQLGKSRNKKEED